MKTLYNHSLDGTVLQPELSGQVCSLGAAYLDVSAKPVSYTPSELDEATLVSIDRDRG